MPSKVVPLEDDRVQRNGTAGAHLGSRCLTIVELSVTKIRGSQLGASSETSAQHKT